jgi:glycosyltransferase involved in cell wall biosynthesis
MRCIREAARSRAVQAHMNRLRIGIDARMSVGSFRGMGRYAREFAAQCEEEIIWLGHAGQASDPLVDHGAGPASYPLWEQFTLPTLCRDLKLDALLCPYNTGPVRSVSPTRLFLVVHDLIYLESRRSVPYGGSPYQLAGRLYRRLVVPSAVARADAIVSVSEFSAAELVRHLRVTAKPLVVVPNTVDASWFDRPSRSDLRDDFILAVSGEAPHKNLQRVVRAFRQARDRGGIPSHVRLRIAGVSSAGKQSVVQLANQLGVAEATEVLPYLPLTEMQELYRAAAFMVFPSLIEGFGIPILEAMASGCPVIVSDRGSLPEVAGGAAMTIDPLRVDVIERAMSRLWSDSELRKELAAKGRKNAERFHPRNVHPQMRAAWNTLTSLCR